MDSVNKWTSNFLKFAFLLVLVAQAAASDATLQEPALTQFQHAVDLLDNYRGKTSSLENARVELIEILDSNPNFAPGYRELARYFIMRGHINSNNFYPGSLEAADELITKAIDINPSYAGAFVLRGHLYRLMGRHKEALEALTKADNLGTNDPWLQNNWADLLIDEHKFAEAAQRYETVVNSQTENKKALSSAFSGLIKYYESVGQLDNADKMYQKQIALEPNTAWNYGNYAYFLLCKRDDYENAINRSRQALDIMDYGVGRFWLAAGLYRKWANDVLTGNSGSAKLYFSEAQSLYPDVNEVVSYSGTCKSFTKIEKALQLQAKP